MLVLFCAFSWFLWGRRIHVKSEEFECSLSLCRSGKLWTLVRPNHIFDVGILNTGSGPPFDDLGGHTQTNLWKTRNEVLGVDNRHGHLDPSSFSSYFLLLGKRPGLPFLRLVHLVLNFFQRKVWPEFWPVKSLFVLNPIDLILDTLENSWLGFYRKSLNQENWEFRKRRCG